MDASTPSGAGTGKREAPAFAPSSCAELKSLVATLTDGSGAEFTYHGRVIEWDTSTSTSIEFEFHAAWFKDRVIQIFVWSERATTLEIYREDSVDPVIVALPGSEEPPTPSRLVSLAVPLSLRSRADSTRLTIVSKEGTASGPVRFGLTEGPAGQCTAAIGVSRFDARTRVLAYTWINIVCVLFALFAPLGSYGFVLVGLPAIPIALRYAGLDTSYKLDISALALALYLRTRPDGTSPLPWRWLRPRLWGLACLPIALAAAYVFAGLFVPLKYASDLEDALNSPRESVKDLELLCRYPERLEVRALVARRYALIRSESEAWGSAVRTIRAGIDTKTFIACLENGRLARVFTDMPELREDEARAFYAALIFYSINSHDDFPGAMREIRSILFHGNLAAGQLSELAWTTFQTRMEKNIGEQVACKDGRQADDCIAARAKCRLADGELERQLADSATWSYLDRRQNTVYIEARDVAASARLSPVCSMVADVDVRQAIGHYEAMLGAIPGDSRLDRPLSTINLRFLAESMLHPQSARPTVRSWVEDCVGRLAKACAQIKDAVIGDGDRKFFRKDRITGNAEWDKAALSQATFKELREFALAESSRNWRKPWASYSR